MNQIVMIILVLGVCSPSAHAQKQDLRWGEFGYYSNWDRYPYAIDSDYEFIGRLPDLREFPKLLKAALDPKMNRSDRAVILSQMRTLSRCAFEKPVHYEGDDIEADYRKSVAKWDDWWRGYGSKLPKALAEGGQRYQKAWRQVAPTPYLEVPPYPILIPKLWSSTISFRSGDYGGVTEEVIEFRVTKNTCSLRRRYRTGWMGKGSWTHEIWEDFSREEAAHFLAVLIYAIDNPWFYGNDKLSEASEKKEGKIGHIRGRPEVWTNYYPSYEWSGILDEDQKIIINHDPWNWDTIDYQLAKQTRLDGWAFGLVFRVVRDLFPDPSWIASKSRWKKVDTPKKRGEQDGSGQPATAPQSKSQGNKNT